MTGAELPNPAIEEARHQEWEAWKDDVVAEFKRLGIDLNEARHDRLARSLELWGERLAALRLAEPGHHAKALAQKVEAYETAKEESP